MSSLLGIEGRAGRLQLLAIMLLTLAIAVTVVWLMGPTEESDIPMLAHVLMVPLVWIDIAANIRRCHDLGRTGWLCLMFLIPLLNVLFQLYLLLSAGDDAANAYG